MSQLNSTGYSATVRLWLVVGDQRVELSHTGPDFVIAKTPIDLPAGDAEIWTTIDDEKFCVPVDLFQGMHSGVREATVRSQNSVAS